MPDTTDPVNAPECAIDYEEMRRSPEFRDLKRRFRVFVLPVSLGFMAWFLAYVLLAAYAHDFMAAPVVGNINVGILMGLGQFVTTFAITMIYVRYANRRLDPIGQKIRAELEQQAGTGSEKEG